MGRSRVWDGEAKCFSCKFFVGRIPPAHERKIICMKGEKMIHTIFCAGHEGGGERLIELQET